MASGMNSNHRERQLYEKHMRALKKAKPKLDTKDPTDQRYILRVKRKREQFVDRQQYAIDRQNEALFDRLVSIQDSTGKLDNWNKSYQPKFHKNDAFRRREQQKIELENKKLLKRLQNSKGLYNRTDWDKSYVKHQKYLEILGKRQKPWKVRMYREFGGYSASESPRKRTKMSTSEDEAKDKDDLTYEDIEDDDYDDDDSYRSDQDTSDAGKLPEIKSARSRSGEERGATASKEEEPLKLPPIHGNDHKNEPEPEPELDDYEKLVKGIEDDDCEAVLEVLAKNAGDKEKLRELMEKYREDHDKDLVDAVKPMFKGDTQDAVLAMLLPKANFDAMCLYNELMGSGEDEDAVIEILGCRSPSEIEEIKEAYKKEYENSLEEDIRSSTSGPYQKLLLRLCQADRETSTTPAKKVTFSEAKKLIQCNRDKTWGTDNDEYIEVLSKKSHPQIKASLTEYKKLMRCELEDTLENQINGDILDSSKTLLKIIRNRPKYYAHKIHDALNSDPVKQDVISRILNTSDPAELNAIKAAYEKAYGSTIEEDMNAKSDEDVKKLLVPLLQGNDEGAQPNDDAKKNKRKKKPVKDENKNDKDKKENQDNEKEKNNEEEDDEEQSEFHGTVTPAPNFEATKDVEHVRSGLVYKDRDGVIKRLTSRSNEQRQVLVKKFAIRYQQELIKLLKSEFGANLVDAIDALMLPPSVQDARRLHEAMKGAGTKEKYLIDIICFRKSKEIIAIKEAYQQEFDRDLADDVRNETSGDFGAILSLLLEAKRSDSKTVKEGAVERDANGLFEAGEDTLGTDEEFIAEVLTSRSRTHLKQVFEKYKEIANRDFLEAMMSELSGDTLKAITAIVTYVTDPTQYFAQIISEISSDDKALTSFIASRSEVDMVEIKQAYASSTKHNLEDDIERKHRGIRRKILLGLIKEEDKNQAGSKPAKKKKGKKSNESLYHPTVVAAKHFSCSRDVTIVKESLGVDKDALIMLLASRGNKQRQEIRVKYQDTYNTDIIEDLGKEFGSGSEAILKALFVCPNEYQASLLMELSKESVDEDILMSTLCLGNNKEITSFKEAYEKASGKSLADVVSAETSEDFQTLMMKLLEGKRDESDAVDQKAAEKDATALHNKKAAADMIDVFATRSKANLKAIFEEYTKIASCDILETVEVDCSGNFKKAMLILGGSVQTSLPSFYCERLHRMFDISTEFAFLIATRAEVDMVEIKAAYEKEYSTPLMEDIKMRYSDDQRNLLFALINEWKQGRKDITQPPGKAPVTSYHPTVAPAASFNATNDAESIYNTLSSAFDLDEVIILVVRRTVKQRKQIMAKYKEKYDKDLISILEEELKIERSLLSALFEDAPDLVVQRLQEATKGAGTNEKALADIICTKTNQEIEKIKKAYTEAFKEDICEVVSRETSGQFKHLLLKILKLERNESPEVSMNEVNEDAKLLYKAGDKRWGTDEEEFVEVFATRSRPHLRAVFKEFKKLAKRDITESLNAELSGDLLDSLLLIVSVSYQGELNSACDALNTKLSEKVAFFYIVVAHSEIDMVEVKEEYKKAYQVSLADDIKKNYQEEEMKILLGLIKEWKPFAKGSNSKSEEKKPTEQFHATVVPSANFDPEKDADTLYNAKGKDPNITMMLIATRTKDQRIQIQEAYEKKYKTNMIDDVSTQLNIKSGNLKPLFLTHQTWLLQSLHEALKGFGTDEKVIIDILCTHDNKELKEIQSAYMKEYEKELADDIGNETSGELKDLLLEILKAERRENQPASQKQAAADATTLYEAGEKKWGTDESKFIKVLTTRSRTHLKQVFIEYKKIAKRSLVESLKDELSGDLEYALIALVTIMDANDQEFWSVQLKEFLGDSRTFMGHLSHRAEVDAVEIKDEYQKSFSTPLANDIGENFSGNLSKLMLALIKEWNPDPKASQKAAASKEKKQKSDFHATVVPVKPFNAAKDCEAIRKTLGKDKAALIDILCSRPVEQRQVILAKYKERYNKANLLKSLKGEFGSELDEMVSGMFVKIPVRDIKKLKEATKAENANKKVLYQILCQRSEQDLQSLKQEYKKANGQDLSEVVGQVTSGDLKSLLTELLKCDRSDVQTVDLRMTKSDAQGLSKPGDEAARKAIIDMFTSKSEPQIKAILEENDKQPDSTGLRTDLLDSENSSQALGLLASFIKDPIAAYAQEIHISMKQDPKYCERIVARHSEIDMVEIKDAYENCYSKTMEDDIVENFTDDKQNMLLALIKEPTKEADLKDMKEYHATVVAAKDFKPADDASKLKKIQGSDADQLITLLTSRTREQRNKIEEEFLKQHNMKFLGYLCSTLKVKEAYLKILFSDSAADEAKQLHDAMKGFGTDEKVLIDVLCVQNNKSLENIKTSYKEAYGKELSEAIESETGGDFQKTLLKIVQATRSESQATNSNKAKSDAKMLYEAGVTKSGTNEDAFIDILTSRSRPQLEKIFIEYKKLANHEIEETIKKEFSGDILDCLLALVSSVRQGQDSFWCQRINQCINKPQTLFACVTERSEIDMVEVKEEYKNSFNVTLADDLRKSYSGNTLKILLGLIKELSPKPPNKKNQRGAKGRTNKTRTTTPPPPSTDNTTSLFHGTVVPSSDFDVANDVKLLKSSFGKDKNSIISLLSSRSAGQRQAVRVKYKETHKEELVDVLRKEFQTNPDNFMPWLFDTTMSSDLELLHSALEETNANNNALVNILCERTDEEILEIKNLYEQAYKQSLDEVIAGRTDGHFGMFLQELLKCDREESSVVEDKKVSADVQGLYQADDKEQKIDEEKLIQTLTSRTCPHLIEMFEEYEKVSSREFSKVLEEKFGGDFGLALLTTVFYMKDPRTHYATKLKKTVAEDRDVCTRLIVERCEVDMVEIKESYQTLYGTNLSDDIRQHYDEDLRSILLSLIKEWTPGEKPAEAELVDIPEVVYHATVLEAANFDPNKDSDAIKEEIGKNKNAVVEILAMRITKQRQEIGKVYLEKEKEVLQDKLIVEFDNEAENILTLLMQSGTSDAEKLHEAMKGLGTKEDVLIDVLCRSTVKDISLTKTQYMDAYGEDLEKPIERETSGDLQNILVQIIKCSRDQSNSVNKKQVEEDATALYKAGEEKLGTDEAKFVEIFTTRSFQHLRLVCEHYKEISKKTVEDVLQQEFSGDVQKALLTLAHFANQPLTKYVSKLQETIKDDSKTFSQLVVERSEIDMVEIKASYKEMYLVSLADDIRKYYSEDVKNMLLALIDEWSPEERKPEPTVATPPPVIYHPTVVSAPEFNAENDVKSIKTSLGCDKDAIVALLTSRSKVQRQEISEAFQKIEEQALEEKLVEEFGANPKDILSLMLKPGQSDIELLHEAMKGIGTKESAIIEILCRRDEKELTEIKKQYQDFYKEDLVNMVEKETGGNLQDLLVRLLKCEREEKDVIYLNNTHQDAEDLYQAGEQKTGTEESVFIDIFTSRGFAHLKMVFEAYQKKYEKSIQESIQKEFSGDVESALSTIVSYVNDPLSDHVTKLNGAVAGDRNAFAKLVIDRAEVDMVEIKELYQKTNERSLADDIKKHYTSDEEHILLGLIKEWVPEKQPTIPCKPPVIYHATVLPAEQFAPEQDVTSLKSYIGNDKNPIISLLTTRNKSQRLAIGEIYEQKENNSLQEKLCKEFGNESEDMLSVLMEASKSDAEKLHEAMKGFGTNESVLIDILCRRTKKEIEEIKTSFKTHSGKDLASVVESETGGDFQKLLLGIITCKREDEKEFLYPKQAERDAAQLYEAGEKSFGTDEHRFIHLFTRRSFQHLKLLFEEYMKTIEESIEKEFSGDMQKALKTIVSYVYNPLNLHISSLNAAIKDDPKSFYQIVVERSEVDMVEIKEDYLKQYNVTLADDIKKHYSGDIERFLLALIKEWDPEKEERVEMPPPPKYHATVLEAPNFNVDSDMKVMQDALVNDKNAIITLLTTRNRNQRQAIREKYGLEMNEDLCHRISSVLGTELSDTILQLMSSPSIMDAELLHGAMKGFGTKEDVLISILCRRNQQDIEAIKPQFKNACGKDLIEMVDDETSGDLNKLLLALLKCERETEATVTATRVEQDATALYKAGEKSWGTDESTFIEIFTKRSVLHLRAVFEQYKKISGNDIVTALNKELDGHLLTAFLALVSSARDPPTYYAGLAKQTVKESPQDFTRLIIERCEIDTVEIKEVYLSVYKRAIADEIKENYTGVQQRLLLGLLDEPWEKLPEESTQEEAIPAKPSEELPPTMEAVEKEATPLKPSEELTPRMKAVEKPQYHATIKPAAPFNPKEYAEKLMKAMKGFGTDEKTIIEVLTSRSNQQRRIIANTYQQEFKKDLLDELKSELGGDMENLTVALMLPNEVFFCQEFNKAVKGFGADEEAMLEIICSQECEGLQSIGNCYKKENDKDIMDVIANESKGDSRLLLEALFLGGHLNASEVDLNEVESACHDINKAGVNKWTGENPVFLSILKSKSRGFMVELFKSFKEISNYDIVDVITKETSGSYKDLLIDAVTSIRDPPLYFAKRLHNALDRMNVDDDTLIRCLAGRSEIDLLDIKQIFTKTFSISLDDLVKKKCRGEYETMLLAILRGN